MIFYPQRLLRSFGHAFRGLVLIWKEEQNFRIHVVCTILVFSISFFLRIHIFDFAIIIITTALLLTLEIINTVFEKFVDLAKPRLHHYVGFIKDVMAGAVLIATITATVTISIVFWPYLAQYIK